MGDKDHIHRVEVEQPSVSFRGPGQDVDYALGDYDEFDKKHQALENQVRNMIPRPPSNFVDT